MNVARRVRSRVDTGHSQCSSHRCRSTAAGRLGLSRSSSGSLTRRNEVSANRFPSSSVPGTPAHVPFPNTGHRPKRTSMKRAANAVPWMWGRAVRGLVSEASEFETAGPALRIDAYGGRQPSLRLGTRCVSGCTWARWPLGRPAHALSNTGCPDLEHSCCPIRGFRDKVAFVNPEMAGVVGSSAFGPWRPGHRGRRVR